MLLGDLVGVNDVYKKVSYSANNRNVLTVEFSITDTAANNFHGPGTLFKIKVLNRRITILVPQITILSKVL